MRHTASIPPPGACEAMRRIDLDGYCACCAYAAPTATAVIATNAGKTFRTRMTHVSSGGLRFSGSLDRLSRHGLREDMRAVRIQPHERFARHGSEQRPQSLLYFLHY